MEDLGCEVIRLDLSGGTSAGLSRGEDFAGLEQYLSEQFDAVLDINSKLPYLLTEDGEPWLDRLGAPFFNYLLDHPLYHHPGLCFSIKNYHVITIDKAHEAYVKEWYPHIKSVSCLPVAGTAAPGYEEEKRGQGPGERSIPLLFSGTGLGREQIFSEMKAQGKKMYELMRLLSESWDPAKEPMEDTVAALMKAEPEAFLNAEQEIRNAEREIRNAEREIQNAAQNNRNTALEIRNAEGELGKTAVEAEGTITFPEWMNRLYPVDRLKRHEKRFRLLTTVAEEGLPLTIMGEGWEETPLVRFSHVTLLQPRPIARSFSVFADAETVLDCNPLFYRGMHDRVPAALINGALCLTDMDPKAEPALVHRKELLYYDPAKPEEAVALYRRTTPGDRREMAEAGEERAGQQYSWEAHGRRLLSIFAKYPL